MDWQPQKALLSQDIEYDPWVRCLLSLSTFISHHGDYRVQKTGQEEPSGLREGLLPGEHSSCIVELVGSENLGASSKD